ncbi:MAG: hypothetical protein N3D17_07815, partial [bacterium]|nr:hypothetical protein [bacterium]
MNLKNRLKQTGEKFYNFYISYWLYLWIIFILTLLNFNFLIIKKFPPPHKIINYIQGIYLGFITFSIPFLWNAYSRILEISKLTVKEIEGILN